MNALCHSECVAARSIDVIIPIAKSSVTIKLVGIVCFKQPNSLNYALSMEPKDTVTAN